MERYFANELSTLVEQLNEKNTIIDIPDYSYNAIDFECFHLENIDFLEYLLIGHDCFKSASIMQIENCNSLKLIKIKGNSFLGKEGNCTIKNCMNLEGIDITGIESFDDYYSFDIHS
jgi:hypothetical protein